MDRTQFLFVCVLIVLLGNSFLPVYAQVPQAGAAPKQTTSPTERLVTEKSVLAESSKVAATSESAAADFCQCLGPRGNAATKNIEQALAGQLHKTGLDYADQPLQDVATQLGEEYGIPIHINKVALEEAGINSDKPITITLHNISVRSALRLMLKSLQLTYVIQDEVLCITTPEDAEKNLKICVYDVRRIAGDNGDLKPLIDTIGSCVAKETWAQNGKGSAEIRSPKAGLLVITQTQAVHDDIRNLLIKLDEMRRDHQGDAGGTTTKPTTGGSAEHRAPATPQAPVAPRKAATFADPVPSEASADNPFSG